LKRQPFSVPLNPIGYEDAHAHGNEEEDEDEDVHEDVMRRTRVQEVGATLAAQCR
jgi:hypothetical protein